MKLVWNPSPRSKSPARQARPKALSKPQPKSRGHNKLERATSGPLMLNAVIDEALFIKKRVQQIITFNDYCRNYGMAGTPQPKHRQEDPFQTDIDLLSRKIDDMEKVITEQRRMNDELRRKLQSQEFDQGIAVRQIGKFTKPLSKGRLSTNRDTERLTTSRLSEQVGLKPRNLQCRSDNASIRKSVDSVHRSPKPPRLPHTQDNTLHHEQLQILNQQFQNLITLQGSAVSPAERTQIRNQLIEVSRRINQLTQHKTRTYHL